MINDVDFNKPLEKEQNDKLQDLKMKINFVTENTVEKLMGEPDEISFFLANFSSLISH